jgi:hypothetical protein
VQEVRRRRRRRGLHDQPRGEPGRRVSRGVKRSVEGVAGRARGTRCDAMRCDQEGNRVREVVVGGGRRIGAGRVNRWWKRRQRRWGGVGWLAGAWPRRPAQLVVGMGGAGADTEAKPAEDRVDLSTTTTTTPPPWA